MNIQYLYFCVFTLLILSQKSNCADPFYEACAPINCGKHNIRYPFYIKGQNSYCGYPGFELNCTNNEYPVLQMAQDDYVLDQFYYNNHSVRVYNAAVLSVETGCLPQIRNLSLDNRFSLVNDSGELVLFTNCSTNVSSELLRYRVKCGEWELAMLRGDAEVGVAMEECRENVVAPVELYGGDGVDEYGELMRRGFVLNWTASDCSACEESGGRCGFDYAAYYFKCFCADRPHDRRCLFRIRKGLLIKALLATFGAAIGILIIVFSLRRKIATKWRKKTESYCNVETFLKNYGSLAPKRYCIDVY